nr:cytochrome c oxidase subunit II [Prunus mume]UTB64849.1 cytochrome c oxidase subunit II [Prunus mume]
MPKSPMFFLVGPAQPAIYVFLNWESKHKSLFFFFLGGGAEQLKNEPTKMIVLEWLFLTIAPCDAAEPWQLGFQDAATPMMQGIMDLHHDIFFFLILILVFVSRILVRALWHFHYKKNPIPQRIVHGTTIEILRTIFPSIILMFIAIPSFALLYSMDEVVVDPAITIKAIGHQWYRTYEYSDYNSSDEQSLTFDSYTIPEDDLELGQSRLLEVDNRVVVPAKTHLRIIVTPADVPHSWAVPSSGVKCDAVPGRLNQISTSVQREGVYYGQCSEICGTNHAFMPIVVEAVPRKDYGSRVSNQLIPQTGGGNERVG